MFDFSYSLYPGEDGLRSSESQPRRRPYTLSMAEDKVTEYRAAYETWQRHLEALHAFFLDKQRIDPLRLKGILVREARSKRKYDVARLRLLGIEEDGPFAGGDDDEDDEG
jgi:hypothetical protein